MGSLTAKLLKKSLPLKARASGHLRNWDCRRDFCDHLCRGQKIYSGPKKIQNKPVIIYIGQLRRPRHCPATGTNDSPRAKRDSVMPPPLPRTQCSFTNPGLSLAWRSSAVKNSCTRTKTSPKNFCPIRNPSVKCSNNQKVEIINLTC